MKSLLEKPKIHYLNPALLRDHPIHVGVVGVGGTGTLVLKELARMNYALRHLGHQGLQVAAYDGDTVSQSNVGRQLFMDSDIGQNKAVAMIHKINLAWGVEWIAVPEYFHDGLKCYNIMISCTDSIKSRKIIATRLSENKSPVLHNHFLENFYYWIDAGNGNNFGQVRLFTEFDAKTKSKNYQVVNTIPYVDIYKDVVEKPDEPSCSLAQALGKQDLMINSMMAQVCCQMLWQLIHKKFIDYKGVYVNLESMSMRALSL